MELKIQVTQILTTEGSEYSAEILGLPSVIKCVGGGQTREEAISEALENLIFISDSLNLGKIYLIGSSPK